MELLLVRHAVAVERGSTKYVDDRARPLTPDGRKRMSEVAAGLAKLVTPGEILTSPVLRARQTADILAKTWRVPVAELDGLGDGDHAATLEGAKRRAADRIALVGHEPWMGELLSYLLTGDVGAVAAPFKKGGAALLTSFAGASPGEWALAWLSPPAISRRLG